MEIEEFARRHNEQLESKSHKDVFMVWLAIMFISVIASHFIMHVTASPTGYVLANPQASVDEITSLLGSIGIFCVAALIGGAGYLGISKHVK